MLEVAVHPQVQLRHVLAHVTARLKQQLHKCLQQQRRNTRHISAGQSDITVVRCALEQNDQVSLTSM